MNAPERVSTRRTDLMAVGVILAATLIAALLAYSAISGFLGLSDDLTRVIVPGTSEITLSESGDYTIFYEYRSTVDGRGFSTPDTLEGLRVALLSLDSRAPVAISSPGSDVEYSLRGRSGVSVLAFGIDHPGVYELTAFYENNTAKPEVVLAIGQGVGRQIVTSIFTGFAAAAIFVIGVAASIALTVIPRIRRNKRAP